MGVCHISYIWQCLWKNIWHSFCEINAKNQFAGVESHGCNISKFDDKLYILFDLSWDIIFVHIAAWW